MNIEQTKEAIRVMQAFVDGKQIEVQRPSAGGAGLVWRSADPLCWDWLNGNYRIKPTATLRPWTADEVPLGAFLRYKGNPQSICILIVSNMEKGLAGYQTNSTYQALLQEMEHSTDGGKNWLPCGVLEEAK